MATRKGIDERRVPFDAAADWPHMVARAADAVAAQAVRRGVTWPEQTARAVATTLPRELGCWLIRRLRCLGWLRRGARIPFDVLDSPQCPGDLRGGVRELVRVAVFGIPGEGTRSDSKRREALFQQRCGEIMREVRDLESLSLAASRALGHPEVHGDPILFGMLRAFIAEREAELRARSYLPRDEREAETPAEPVRKFRIPLSERVQQSLSKLRLELEAHLTSYNEAGASDVLTRIKELRRRYPAHVKDGVVGRCEEQVDRLVEKRDEFREQLDELVRHAAAAAERGDLKTATWVLRRLDAIHTLLPAVLSEARLKELSRLLRESAERHERHEAARQLVQRERAVGAEIKRLGAVVHRYHALLEKASDDAGVNRQVAEEYRKAVEEIRSHDDDWLADLMIELDCLLEDLHGSDESRRRAEIQVDKFVENVRSALRRMQAEVKAVQQERTSARPDRQLG